MSDESDSSIRFNKKGYCNCYTQALSKINSTTYFPNEIGQKNLMKHLPRLKRKTEIKHTIVLYHGISRGVWIHLILLILSIVGCRSLNYINY